MKRTLAITACVLALPGMAAAATRSYDVGPFEEVSVAANVQADIRIGPAPSVVAETGADSLDDLRIAVEGKVLRIDRPRGSWLARFFSGPGDEYRVHVVTPALRSVTAAAGAEVKVDGPLEGDFAIAASSGSAVRVPQARGGAVKVTTSSGSNVDVAGSCTSLEAEASSGSDLDADDLRCETVTVHASSGGAVSVAASKRVQGAASSGSNVRVRGRPALVQVETSSGANVSVKE